MKIRIKFLFLGLIGTLFFLLSCKKDKLFSKGSLSFSTENILFDTVFTTIGSATQNFKVYNKSINKLKIESIRLMGGESSPFRLNFDGVPGINFSDIIIEGKDSLFGFVDVTLNVNNSNYPLVIEDSIQFIVNGNAKYVRLSVWGQDVYIHNKDITSGAWLNDKPHLVYGYTAVDSATSLTIPAGTIIYFHKNASLLVYKGTLDVQGTKDNKVKFLGDRQEIFYKDVPGQWYGIRFVEAKASSINNALIKNGQVGVQVDSTGNVGSNYTVTLSNSEIYNQSSFGIYGVSGAKVKVYNTVINNCALASTYLFAGGSYNFNYCTIANYTSVTRNTPLLIVQNWFQNGSVAYVRPIAEGTFANCVFYGALDEEFKIDTISGTTLNLHFENCIFKGTATSSSIFQNCQFNVDPLFVNPSTNDFHFYLGSSLIDAGNNDISSPYDKDIDENVRVAPTDISAYQY